MKRTLLIRSAIVILCIISFVHKADTQNIEVLPPQLFLETLEFLSFTRYYPKKIGSWYIVNEIDKEELTTCNSNTLNSYFLLIGGCQMKTDGVYYTSNFLERVAEHDKIHFSLDFFWNIETSSQNDSLLIWFDNTLAFNKTFSTITPKMISLSCCTGVADINAS